MPAPPALPHNILAAAATQRTWRGVQVEVARFHCAGPAVHKLSFAGDTRLSVVLEEVGGVAEPRLHPERPNPIAHMPRHMHFAPAGMEVWGFTAAAHFVKAATLCFDLPTLAQQMGYDLTAAAGIPRLRFGDDRVWTLTRMLSEAVDDPDPSSGLYGDGLLAAITARLLTPRPAARAHAKPGKALPPWRLRRVTDYLEASLPDRVSLAELAHLAGLSISHFSRAFKAATGMAPYQWQLNARIRRAQTQLLRTDASLEQIAEANGFADAVHFGRRFRQLTGAAPAAWRREHKG
ncbi:MAG: AraC family transcriptional regulator [Steroidobacteraceae bacterium]